MVYCRHMNPVLVAILAVAVLGVGIYIGVSGMVTQYAFDVSGSHADQIACSADAPTGAVGRPIVFSASGIPGGTVYHWAVDEGSFAILADGRLRATFATPGPKTAWLFYLDGARWRQVNCTTNVR